MWVLQCGAFCCYVVCLCFGSGGLLNICFRLFFMHCSWKKLMFIMLLRVDLKATKK